MILPSLFSSWLLLPAILVGPAAELPPPAEQDLVALIGRLHGPAAADRLAAAQAIAALPPSGHALYAERLAGLHYSPLLRPTDGTLVSVDSFRTLILEAWGQVPNPDYPHSGSMWLRNPEPVWVRPKPVPGVPRQKRPPPHDPETLDWLSALAELDLEANPLLQAMPDRVEVRAQALEAVALLRALARNDAPDALDPLFTFAFDLDGVFRDECGRAIRSMESRAIPGLIRRHYDHGKGMSFRQRRYSSYQLDRMDRASPLKAVSNAPDDRTRAEIIHAYGEVRSLDAVEAILGQLDAPARRVREEARWAWLRYVTGPPPPDAPKRFRKLVGGKEEAEEKEDYLNYREMATLALMRRLAELRGEPCNACARGGEVKPPPWADPQKMTAELLSIYDARRSAEWDAQFDEAHGKAVAGDLAGAVAGYAFILAHDPFYARRSEMADAFIAYSDLLRRDDPERADDYLRQALLLSPSSPRARKADAEMHLREGLRRIRAGQEDPGELERALAIDPQLERATEALADLKARREHRAARQAREMAAVCGGGLVLFALLGWMLARRLTQVS